MKLDLKKFRHVSTDGKSTKLKHDEGHFLVIAHKNLSKDYKSQLEALANSKTEDPSKLGVSARDAKDVQDRQSYAEGGQTTKPIFGSQAERDAMDERDRQKYSQQPSDMTSPAGAEEEFKRKQLEQEAKNKAEGYAKGGEVCHACGGPVKMYAEGDMVQQSEPAFEPTEAAQPPNDLAASIGKAVGKYGVAPVINTVKNAVKGAKMLGQTAGRMTQGAEHGIEQGTGMPIFHPQADEEQQVAAQGAQQSQAQVNQAQNQPVQLTPEEQAQSQVLSQQSASLNQKPQQQPDIASSMNDAQGMVEQGLRSKAAGITNAAQAQGALGQQQAAVLENAQKAQTKARAAFQQHFNDLNQERLNHIEDIKQGYINPDQYWTGDKQGNGGHSKVATAIGMILAGFNPTNRPNAAIEMLKYQMDKNMEAQKENLGSKQNLLKANLQQFGNIKDATDMTRLMQNDLMQSQLQTAAAKAQTPMAKAAAQQAVGQLQMDAAPILQNFAMRRSLMGLANNGGSPESVEHMLGYMRVVNPEMAKEMEGRYVPGIGLGTVPIPQAAREEIVAHQKLNQIGQDVLNYSKTHTNVIPGTPEYNVGVQKAMILQQAIREGMLGTVFRESEKPLLQKFIDDNPAGALKTLSSQPKIRTILESNANTLNLIKKNYGLPVQQQAQQQAEPQYKTVNGIKYMRGPNGEAVKVP